MVHAFIPNGYLCTCYLVEWILPNKHYLMISSLESLSEPEECGTVPIMCDIPTRGISHEHKSVAVLLC